MAGSLSSSPFVGHALVTGAAGFIGSHVVDRLRRDGWAVTGIDSMDPFYPRVVKETNIAEHMGAEGFRFLECDILDDDLADKLADAAPRFDVIVHLAAKAGVRPSLLDPEGYRRTNVDGTANMLKLATGLGVPHFILASSSSVYGECPNVPWREDEWPLSPISPYASSKLAAEALAETHASRHGGRVTVLRFFTAYGPRQRPDLAIHKFVSAIAQGRSITMYGDGGTRRDYTFVEDIVQGIMGAIHRTAGGAYGVYNLGNSTTVTLAELIATIEEAMGRKATIERLPEQPGDVPRTFADISRSAAHLGYAPTVQLNEGVRRFLEWYEHVRMNP